MEAIRWRFLALICRVGACITMVITNESVFFSEAKAGKISSVTYECQGHHEVLKTNATRTTGLLFVTQTLHFIEVATIDGDFQPRIWTQSEKDICKSCQNPRGSNQCQYVIIMTGGGCGETPRCA
ncbi:hypothetical protein B9Z55_022142 [Caenorhabditis nigoni]|nr:hypothetical protein B9Z55_022142 [Caenorhabditis nigoni]